MRSEFWWFQLFFVIALVGAMLILTLLGIGMSEEKLDLALAVEFALFLPVLSVTARRLHDLGLTGWLQAPVVLIYLEDLGLIFPGFGNLKIVENITNAAILYWFVILIICLWPSKTGSNKYGKSLEFEDASEVFS